MNIRRDRTHQCGLTNIDFRTKGDFQSLERYQPNNMYNDFGTMGKSQYKRMPSQANFKEQVSTMGGFKTLSKVDPRGETTKEFYQQKSKAFKQPVQIGKRHDTQLEDTKWTDKVFTGDNYKTTAKLSLQARDRNEYYMMDVKKRRVKEKENQDKEKSASKPDSKRSQSSKVGAKKVLEGLEGIVDIQRVKDFRKAIRRRYASRSNF